MRRFFINAFALTTLVVLLAGCNQNADDVSNGHTLENAPKPTAGNNPKPLEDTPEVKDAARGNAPRGMRDVEKTFAKAFFMHNFVEALYSVPKNKMPNPKWASPLSDTSEKGRVWCADCHDPKKGVDVSRVPRERTAKVDELEKDHEFMVELMTKWVGRLNSGEFGAKAKLKQSVTCTTCHAVDPRDQ